MSKVLYEDDESVEYLLDAAGCSEVEELPDYLNQLVDGDLPEKVDQLDFFEEIGDRFPIVKDWSSTYQVEVPLFPEDGEYENFTNDEPIPTSKTNVGHHDYPSGDEIYEKDLLLRVISNENEPFVNITQKNESLENTDLSPLRYLAGFLEQNS